MNELNQDNAQAILGAPKSDITSVGLSILAAFVAGFLGGFFILVCTFLFLGTAKTGAGGIFPYVLSLVGLIAILMSRYLTLFLSRVIFPDKYRGDGVSMFAQTFAFSIILYILITPLYVYMGHVNADKVIFVFSLHVLLNNLGVSLISEVLAGYRHVLVAIYASFFGFIISSFISVALFQTANLSDSTLYSLVAIIILIETTTTAFQRIFEFIYYKFYTLTGLDPLSDIFSRIEEEEKELIRKAEATLTKFE